MWHDKKSSSTRLRAAQNAFRNRQEILKAWSQGQISRRDLLKWGIFSVGGVLVAKSGLSPFVGAARADNIPTGLPSSPLFGVKDFSTPMPNVSLGGADVQAIVSYLEAQSVAAGKTAPGAVAPHVHSHSDATHSDAK